MDKVINIIINLKAEIKYLIDKINNNKLKIVSLRQGLYGDSKYISKDDILDQIKIAIIENSQLEKLKTNKDNELQILIDFRNNVIEQYIENNNNLKIEIENEVNKEYDKVKIKNFKK